MARCLALVALTLIVPSLAQHLRGSDGQTSSSSTELWPQRGTNHTKCMPGKSDLVIVPDQLRCQQQAIAAGHRYYQYLQANHSGKCATFAACSEPITGTKKPWKLFTDSPLWQQTGADHSKCMKSKDSTFVTVRDQISCELRAEAAGHRYYQYRQKKNGKGKCATFDTCSEPITGTGLPWKIFVQHLSLQQVMTCPKGATSTTSLLCKDQYNQIVDQISAVMNDLKQQRNCTNNDCLVADFAGCVLRAAGHDFMDFRNGAGGSDGCLRFDDNDNRGLINCLNGDFDLDGDIDLDNFHTTLHDVYTLFCDQVSLADFLVISAEAVMAFTSQAVDLKADFRDSFRYGRTTSTTCANAVALPNPANGCDANEVTFLASDALALSWRQTAALMGVHTLGKASVQNSGYSGWWTDESNVASFNNNYYISIVNKGWGPTPVGANSKPQWERRGSKHDDKGNKHPEMMLNTDMCLVYKDVLAEESNCCAWERFQDLQEKQISDTFDGKPIYCGFQPPHSHFERERNWCCGQGLENECAHKAGNPQDLDTPQGPATSDVHEFAAKQDIWLEEFMKVWKLVTEKGTVSLNTLKDTCV